MGSHIEASAKPSLAPPERSIKAPQNKLRLSTKRLPREDIARSQLTTTSGGMLHLPSLPDCVQPLGLPMRLQARFRAILITPQ